MKIAVLLSGCGVYDGAEIHESVCTLLALDQLGVTVQCIAPDQKQYHVIHHTNGDTMDESRNMLIESARIARGDILSLTAVDAADFDGLVLPGGFGAAKNLTTWAFSGPEGTIDEDVKKLIVSMQAAGKPIAALCVSPVVIAQAFSASDLPIKITLGNTEQASDYDIESFHQGVASVGMQPSACYLGDIFVDDTHKIITSPCYMQQASLSQIYQSIFKACEKLISMAG